MIKKHAIMFTIKKGHSSSFLQLKILQYLGQLLVNTEAFHIQK